MAEPSVRDAIDELREEIARSFVLTTERLQETFEDSVRRGRLTRTDAQRLADSLLEIVRTQRRELLEDLERVLGRSAGAALDVHRRALEHVRRAAGLGEGEPIPGYDDLTAAQVRSRLGDLGDAQLERLRSRELAGAARKTVLADIDRRLRRR